MSKATVTITSDYSDAVIIATFTQNGEDKDMKISFLPNLGEVREDKNIYETFVLLFTDLIKKND